MRQVVEEEITKRIETIAGKAQAVPAIMPNKTHMPDALRRLVFYRRRMGGAPTQRAKDRKYQPSKNEH